MNDVNQKANNMYKAYMDKKAQAITEADTSKIHNDVKHEICKSIISGFTKKFPNLGLDIKSKPKSEIFEWVVFLKANKATMRVEGTTDLNRVTLAAMIDKIYEGAYDISRALK